MRIPFFPFSFASRLVALAAAVLLPSGCGGEGPGPGPEQPRTVEAAQSPAGRVGSHGMILAGEPGSAVLSHIPMFAAPHDVQLVVRGAIMDSGKPLPTSFSDRPFTFLPERTSLDALRNGVTRELRGTIFLGNFEQGGRPVAAGVRFAVDRVVHQHILGVAAPPAAPAELGYLVFGSRARAFAVHFIGAAPSFDEVLSITLGADAPSDADLARGIIAHEAGKPDALSSRLGARTRPASVVTLTEGARTFAVHTVATLSCLTGPDFVDTCD